MSRFSNLEFDANSEHNAPDSEVVRDEAYFMSEAQQNFELGEFEPALRAYAKVLEFNPQQAAAWTGQVRMLIELEEFREARLWADKALERFPHEPELLAAKAVALGRMGDLKEAMAFSDAAIEERGDTPYIWLARGDVLLANREKLADYCFEKAFTLARTSWVLPWLASRIYCYYQKFAVALKLAQQALALEVGKGAIWLQLGVCQQALGLAVPARNSFEQALQLNPHDRVADRLLIEQRQGQGVKAQLRGWWRRIFK